MQEPMIICSAKNGERWNVQLLHVPQSDGCWNYKLVEQIKSEEGYQTYEMKGVALRAFWNVAHGCIQRDWESGDISAELAGQMKQSLAVAVETQGGV